MMHDKTGPLSRLGIWIPRTLHQTIRLRAMHEDRTIQQIVTAALTAYLEKK